MESKKKRQARQKANREISTMLGLITAGMFSVLAIGAGKYMKQMDVVARENNRQSVVIKKKKRHQKREKESLPGASAG